MALQESVNKIIEALGGVAKAIEKLTEALRKTFEKLEEHKRLLRRPPKWYTKANTPAMIVRKCRLFHCRNNC